MKKVLNESHIRIIVSETLKRYLNENYFGVQQMQNEETDERLSDMNQEDDEEKETRDSIESFFKRPGVNNAPYAYACNPV